MFAITPSIKQLTFWQPSHSLAIHRINCMQAGCCYYRLCSLQNFTLNATCRASENITGENSQLLYCHRNRLWKESVTVRPAQRIPVQLPYRFCTQPCKHWFYARLYFGTGNSECITSFCMFNVWKLIAFFLKITISRGLTCFSIFIHLVCRDNGKVLHTCGNYCSIITAQGYRTINYSFKYSMLLTGNKIW